MLAARQRGRLDLRSLITWLAARLRHQAMTAVAAVPGAAVAAAPDTAVARASAMAAPTSAVAAGQPALECFLSLRALGEEAVGGSGSGGSGRGGASTGVAAPSACRALPLAQLPPPAPAGAVITQHRIFLAALNLAHQNNLAWQAQQQQEQQAEGGAGARPRDGAAMLSRRWVEGRVLLRQGEGGDVLLQVEA